MSSEPEERRVIKLKCTTCDEDGIPLGAWAQHACPGPRLGELWHPADDPEDCVIVTGTSGAVVFYQAPSDARRGRSMPWNNSANLSDFTRYFIPQEAPVSDREQLLAAIERVRAQHTYAPINNECYECSQRDYPDYSVPWPCPTIRALDGEEQSS